jgi:hypothetical protein
MLVNIQFHSKMHDPYNIKFQKILTQWSSFVSFQNTVTLTYFKSVGVLREGLISADILPTCF